MAKGKDRGGRRDLDEALEEIGRLSAQGAAAIPKIVARLCAGAWDVRKAASEALIAFGEEVVPHVTSHLKSRYFENEDLLYWSIQVLGGLGKETAVTVLLEWLADPSFPRNYREFIVRALAGSRSARAVEPLILALSDESFEVQQAAAETLKGYGKRIIPQLQNAFASDKVEIRTWVSRILGQLLGREAITFFKNMLSSDKRELRYYAVSALEEIGDEEALRLVLTRLCDPSFLVRVRAADILRRRGETVLPDLLSLLKTGTTDERVQAAKIVYGLMGGAAFPVLRERIGSADLESKLLVLSAVAEAGAEDAVPHLVEAFRDPNWLVQRHAANLLSQIGAGVIDGLRLALARADSEEIRRGCVETLCDFGERAIEALREVFPQGSRREKARILRCLEGAQSLRTMWFLVRALADPNWSVRNRAFEMLKPFADRTIDSGDGKVSLGDLLVEVSTGGLEDENDAVKRLLVLAARLDVYRRRASDRDGADAEPKRADATQHQVPPAERPRATPSLFDGPDEPYALSIDDLLLRAIEAGASDIHLGAGYPPVFRMKSHMMKQELPVLTRGHTASLARQVLAPALRDEFERAKELDLSHEIPGASRFRLNVYQEVSGIGMVFRVIPGKIPDLDEIGVPQIVKELCRRRKGLLLVTGPTGSGKSTTLAAMINHINHARKDHIITIEDPVEFLHKPVLCKITQRELKVSTHSFAGALRSALREDPNIILVGEMRDLETIELAIVAAETGHLVLGTLHTSSAASTIDRIIDAFPAGKQEQIRATLTEGLIGVIAQTLVPRKDRSGLVAAFEVMLMTSAIGNLVREGKTGMIRDYILQGKSRGMQLLDDALAELIKGNVVTFDDALSACYDKDSFRKRYGPPGGGGGESIPPMAPLPGAAGVPPRKPRPPLPGFDDPMAGLKKK